MDALLEGAAPAGSFSFGFGGGFGAAESAAPDPPEPSPALVAPCTQPPALAPLSSSVPPGLAERALNNDQLERIFFTLDCRTLSSASRANRQWRDAYARVARVPQWISTLSRYP